MICPWFPKHINLKEKGVVYGRFVALGTELSRGNLQSEGICHVKELNDYKRGNVNDAGCDGMQSQRKNTDTA